MTAITAVKATPISIPLRTPYRWSCGINQGFSHTIVEIETDDGVVGLGEAPSAIDAMLINEGLGPRLIGFDPHDRAGAERRCLPTIRVMRTQQEFGLLRAWGGIEMALWDLAGKLENRSVASLMGGRYHDAIPFSEYFAFRVGEQETPAQVAAYCASMAEEHGSRFFEGKVAVKPFGEELKMLREVRAAIGDEAELRLDANMKWSVIEARERLGQLEPFRVRSIEEPVATFQELAALRSTTRVSFSSHDARLADAVRYGAPDAFVINLQMMGGLRRTASFVEACAELGVTVWFWSLDTGIATAAYLQVASVIESWSEPSQQLLRWQADEVVAEGTFSPKNDQLAVPTGPGLGVTLDRDSLRRCHERFRSTGAFDQFSYHTRDEPS